MTKTDMTKINKVSDFKDGTIFVLLGSEVLGSEELNTCSNYVYIKIGDKLLNKHGWFPVSAYNDLTKEFSLKNKNSRFTSSLEYEIMSIYENFDIHRLDFDEIYHKTKTEVPLWERRLFHVSSIGIEEYFLNNFDIDIIVDDGEDKK